MDLTQISPRSGDGAVHVIVEIPRGSQNKYEYDKDLGVIALDRVLYSAVHYPTEYGFIPSTRSEDGELLDVLVMAEHPTFSGCLVKTRLLGMLTITHDNGMPESKLLAVPVAEPRFEQYRDVSDVPEHMIKEIEHFFDIFRELEGKDLGVVGWKGAPEAEQMLEQAIKAQAGA